MLGHHPPRGMNRKPPLMLEHRPRRGRKQGRGGGKPGGMDPPGREAFVAASVANLSCLAAGRLGHSPPQPWQKTGPEPPLS
jgi:hypothetical protein